MYLVWVVVLCSGLLKLPRESLVLPGCRITLVALWFSDCPVSENHTEGFLG